MKSLFYRLLAIPGLALLLSIPSVAQAQHQDHEILWPTLEGQELLDSVRVNFKPLVILNYNNARDQMYSYIDNHDGMIQCIYTGQTAAINPNTTTPRADAGNANFNAEHIYPQSMGASSGNANSDLHHLQPSNANVNSSRGNLPFGYVPSASTNRWWSGTTTQTTMPAGDLTIWSRTGSSNFQPKDDSQGNVARAMFYFYSIYTNEALAANAGYFDMQSEALLNFHRSDPVDEREWIRTNRAAEFQEGLVNPFILDTTLVARIFFVGQTIDPPPNDDDGGDGGGDDNGDDNGDNDGAPIASFTFSNTFDCNNQDNAPIATFTGVSISDFGRNGVGCNPGGGTHNNRDWPVSETIDPGFYTYFSVTADNNYKISATPDDELLFNIRRSNTGPAQMEVRYSTDGVNFELLGNTGVPTNDADVTMSMPELDEVDYFEVRFYAWGGTSPNGTLRFNEVTAPFSVGTTTSISHNDNQLPSGVVLEQNYPNPFNPTTSITFSIPENSMTRLEVYNMVGQRMAVLADGVMSQGSHTVNFDASGLSSGIYLYRLQVDGVVTSKRMTLIK